ncbi:MAG: hypothetical protein JW751_01065 [Polyangiaceae bacterium]|nr:hypothetical protein [Polyangiaceae bacterium]
MGLLILAVMALASRRTIAAPPIAFDDVPPDLQSWVPWVLDGLGEKRCPEVAGARVCYWPGELVLDVGDAGATFQLRVIVDQDTSVPLPGSSEHWPQDVGAGAESAVVLGVGTPMVVLGRGAHELTGRFVWDTTPESLPIPSAVGLVSLRVRGQDVLQPRRDKSDSVWLGRSDTSLSNEPERVEVEVFRRLGDGVPSRIDTEVVLRVSGRARELALGRPLLPGSRPLELSAEIPVRLDEQGMLFAQVRAGEHVLKLAALLPTPPQELGRPPRTAPWPEQEIWAWAPAPALRVVQVTGLAAIDSARTNLPEAWRDLSAYVAGSDAKLTLTTMERGQATPPPNKVTLERELWLDEDGRAFTVRDKLAGTMNGDWRLDLTTGELGHVRFASDDQLITVGASGHRGFEVRNGQLKVVAEWRQPSGAGAPLPAAGWSEDLEHTSVLLHLPSGWTFLGAWGVDEVSGDWLEPWNLFGLLYVLVIALVMARMTRWYWGVLSLAALVLCHQYDVAPYLGWGVLLVLLAMLRVLRGPRWRFVIGLAAMVTVVQVLGSTVTFAGNQLRAAAFPDDGVDDGRVRDRSWSLGAVGAEPSFGLAQPEQQVAESRMDSAIQADIDEYADQPPRKGKGIPSAPLPRGWQKKVPLQQQLAVDAVVQTGPGIPEWQGRTHHLGWRRPVRRDETFRVFVLRPWQTGLLGLVRVFALLAFAFGLVRALVRSASSGSSRPVDRAPPARAAVVASLFAAVLLAGAAVARPARAEIPSPETLGELEKRLTRAPDCGDACVSVADLALTVREAAVALDVEVHVGKPTAYQLPGPATSWVPRLVSVDGKLTRALALRPDGYLHLRLEPGRHRVKLEGPVGSSDLTLTLGTPARRVTVAADGWDVDGVRDGRVEGSVHLARRADTAMAPGTAGPERDRASLPPWLEIHRTLEIGVTWRLRTKVTRVSPADEPLAVRFPLLPGEEVTESTLVADRGVVLLSLGREQRELEFTSVVKPADTIEMVAAEDQPWTEAWSLECGAIWHCEAEGIAPIQHEVAGVYQPLFRPWPGERVAFAFTRPAPAPGVSTTTDRATIEVAPETGLTSVSLTIRTSAGGIQALGLPAGATVMGLEVAGKPQPIQVRDGKLTVVLEPGQQNVSFSFRYGSTPGPWLTTPEVRVGEAVNTRTSIAIPERRFVIYTTGPGRGGVVLLWGVWALLMAAAVGLSALPYHPLRPWEWAALALGFPLIPWQFLVPVAAWFFLVGHRATWRGPATYRKNLAQLLIVGTTLAAAGVVLAALHAGLVETPTTLVSGAGSNSRRVQFVVDRVLADAALPRPSVLTAPDWVFRLFFLAWAAWLTSMVIRTGRSAWAAFTRDGVLGPFRVAAADDVGDHVSAAPTVGSDGETGHEEDTVRTIAGVDETTSPGTAGSDGGADTARGPDEKTGGS